MLRTAAVFVILTVNILPNVLTDIKVCDRSDVSVSTFVGKWMV